MFCTTDSLASATSSASRARSAQSSHSFLVLVPTFTDTSASTSSPQPLQIGMCRAYCTFPPVRKPAIVLAELRAFGINMAPRTFAIGDIHGEPSHLFRLLSSFPRLTAEDTVVFLGDFIDRGPNSKEVIDYVMSMSTRTQAKV